MTTPTRALLAVAASGVALGSGLAGCANTADAALSDAILLNSQSSAVRNAIRAFVREDVSGAYIVDPDSLAKSPELELRQRIRTEATTEAGLAANPSYRLKMDNRGGCYLIHDGIADGARLRMPGSARCGVYVPEDDDA